MRSYTLLTYFFHSVTSQGCDVIITALAAYGFPIVPIATMGVYDTVRPEYAILYFTYLFFPLCDVTGM